MFDFWRFFFLWLAIYYGVIIPLQIYMTCTWKLSVIDTILAEELPLVVMKNFQRRTELAERFGFVVRQHVHYQYKDCESFVRYHWHPERKMTYAAAVWLNRNGKIYDSYDSFCIWYVSGHTIEILNREDVAFWLREPKEHYYPFSPQEPVLSLYELHQYLMMQHEQALPGEERISSEDWRVESARESNKAFYRQQVAMGFLRHDEKAALYRCTLWGAYHMMLHLYWPFSWITRAELRQNAQALKTSYKKWKMS